MIYVTHDQTEAMTLGDRIAVMNAGRVEQVGAPAEVYRQPANRFVAEFIGASPMNCLAGRLDNVGGQLRFVAEGLDWSVAIGAEIPPAREVVLGIRPEHIRLRPLGQGDEPARAWVTATDWLGDATIVHLELRGPNEPARRIQARSTAQTPWSADQPVALELALEHAVWFDRQTGDNLTKVKHEPQ
jgi:ABC-type sugar transport system ATPase subunit